MILLMTVRRYQFLASLQLYLTKTLLIFIEINTILTIPYTVKSVLRTLIITDSLEFWTTIIICLAFTSNPFVSEYLLINYLLKQLCRAPSRYFLCKRIENLLQMCKVKLLCIPLLLHMLQNCLASVLMSMYNLFFLKKF